MTAQHTPTVTPQHTPSVTATADPLPPPVLSPDLLELPDPPEFRLSRRPPAPAPPPVAEPEPPVAKTDPLAAKPKPPVAELTVAAETADSTQWTDPWGFALPDERTRRRRARRRRRAGTGESDPAVLAPRRRPRATRRALRLIRGPLLMLAIAAWIVGAAAGAHHHYRARDARPRTTRRPGIVILPAPSAFALATIPPGYLRLYVRAGNEYGLGWTLLAAVGQIESHSGTSQLAGVSAGSNDAGAEGPAQFLASTWERFGVDADGRGQIDPYDPADAITAMAAYLKASGAPQNWEQALLAYNHSQAYADSVLALAARLQANSKSV
jgi:hypothetical protein